MFLNNFNTKGLLDNITAVGVMKRHLNERLFLVFENNDEIIETTDEISVEGNDTIKIANEAVATYAGIAVSEVSGVYGMAGGFAGITEALSGKKNLAKGIKVDVGEKSAKI